MNDVYDRADKGSKAIWPWKIESAGSFPPDFTFNCDGLFPYELKAVAIPIIWDSSMFNHMCAGGIGGPDNFITGILVEANGDMIYFKSAEFRPFEVDYLIGGEPDAMKRP